jgi:YbbR domain-containing protein
MIHWKRPLQAIVHNFVWKLVALAGAVVIWVLVASEPELSTFTTVRLEFRNLPENLEISSTPMETVTLELRGPAGELRNEGVGRRPSVVLDMSDVMPGQRTFQIAGDNVSLPRGVTLVRSVPPEVRFDFEPGATRLVPVQVRFANTGPNGPAVSSFTVQPDQLPITGPASHVARVMAAVTDPVDLPTPGHNEQVRVNAFVSDSYVHFDASPQVLVTVTMKK